MSERINKLENDINNSKLQPTPNKDKIKELAYNFLNNDEYIKSI